LDFSNLNLFVEVQIGLRSSFIIISISAERIDKQAEEFRNKALLELKYDIPDYFFTMDPSQRLIKQQENFHVEPLGKLSGEQ
jgi:hypothetical protein